MSDINTLATLKATKDISRIFLAFMVSNGDLKETARLTGESIHTVSLLARAEHWDQKLEENGMGALAGTEDSDKEAAKSWARATCYIQALRLRGVVDKVLHQIYENEENVEKFCTERDKRGNPFLSMKPLKELVDAAERCHQMLYRAVGDAAPKASTSGRGGVGASIENLHLHIIKQMQDQKPIPVEKVKEIEEEVPNPVPTVLGYLDGALGQPSANPPTK